MPVHQLVIAPTAKIDLKGIYQYGLPQRGETQSESYLDSIKKQLWTLTTQPLIGVDRSELLSVTISLSIESHTLFYRVTLNRIEIIRVLHSRQDSQRHLK